MYRTILFTQGKVHTTCTVQFYLHRVKYTPHVPYENGTFVSDIGIEHWADLTRIERPVSKTYFFLNVKM